jgi:acetylornithine deacetylase/succinyl-diaminopimelate desuccinylase-like protein
MLTGLDATAEVTGLLQELIRSQCVNDGTPDSGHEARNSAILRDLLEGAGIPTATYEPRTGRQSLVARLEGSDPAAPTLLLMGHTDVVPANPGAWQRDPFAAELVDGWVWGRGAIDMLNLTASMAVAVRRLATSGWRPHGTLIFLAVADEEAGGSLGAQWLVEKAADAVLADYVLTESGGVPLRTPQGTRLVSYVAEKGAHWLRIAVHGTAGHGSRPLRTDNALVKAAEVVRRLAAYRPQPLITETWRDTVALLGLDEDLSAALVDPERIWAAIDELPLDMARTAHAATHLTVAPTVARGGTKTNVIPDRVTLEIDTRTLPGQSAADVDRLLDEALGDLRDAVEVEWIQRDEATTSPLSTPLWGAMERAADRLRPGATLLPTMAAGGTDARFFRRLGIPAFGFGLFSDRMSLAQWMAMFHAADERVDQDSLRLSVDVWQEVARELLS